MRYRLGVINSEGSRGRLRDPMVQFGMVLFGYSRIQYDAQFLGHSLDPLGTTYLESLYPN
jgi:hypothetical protein